MWFSDAELVLLRQAAATPGRGVTVARFVAEAALVAAGRPPVTTGKRRPPSRVALAEIALAAAAVNRIGNNLNQLAREYNATGQRAVGTSAAVVQAEKALQELTDAVQKATGPP